MQIDAALFDAGWVPAEMSDTKDSNWKWFIGTMLVVIGVGISLYSLIHPDLEKINQLTTSLAKTNAAIKVVADKQGGDSRALVDDILAAAKVQQDTGNVTAATRLLDALPNIITTSGLPSQSIPSTVAGLEHFRASSERPVTQAALNGLVALANYQSSGRSVPTYQNRILSAQEIEILGTRFRIKNGLMDGDMIDNSGGHGFDIDGAILQNVVIRNARIVYRGGPLTLQNVHFVNCTFDVQNVPHVDQLLQVVIHDTPVTDIVG
jgi:hypothetical protein